MIVLTKSFRKSLSVFDTRIERELLSLVSRYRRWLAVSMFQITEYRNCAILKWYLNGKRVRVVVAKYFPDTFVPLAIFRKESKGWWNIGKDFQPEKYVLKASEDIENDDFGTFDFE